MSIDRREFLKAATVGAGMAVTGTSLGARDLAARGGMPSLGSAQDRTADIAVVGAGTFGLWTALNLRRLGARVTVVDAYGTGNSRQTSGDETRGVRTSYGDRPHGRLWTRWAGESLQRWRQWDEEGRQRHLPQVFFNTGDLILREKVDEYIENTRAHWDALGMTYEVLHPDEVTHRWPWIRFEKLGVALYEPAAGVVRARGAIQSVGAVFQEEGGVIRLGRASLGGQSGGRLERLNLEGSEPMSASTVIFACGPWFPKVFPELMAKRLRTPMGHVFYFAVPPGDPRFVHPNMPSWGVPGATGWPALGPDHRGFRVRTGGRPAAGAAADPDLSDRWIDKEYHERPREILARHFPDLVGAPINETRTCHYETSVDRNFIVDRHPDFDNVWLVGGGSAEAFKFGPVLGAYIARRVLGLEDDPELAANFRLKKEEFADERSSGE